MNTTPTSSGPAPWVAPSLMTRGIRKLRRLALQPLRSAGMALGANDERILALKNRHAGRRAFVLGNGPSLKVADLDRLEQEITFASNKVYLAFDQTAWRPTYYSVCDKLVARNNAQTIAATPLNRLMSDAVRDFFGPDLPATWVRELSVPPGEPDTVHPFSDNLLVGHYGGCSIVFNQLQMAYYMGIREVILIGLDFSFQLPSQQVATEVPGAGYEVALRSQGEVNHFHPDYRKAGEAWAVPNMEGQRAAFRSALARFEADGRRIVNASRTTKLDVFPRADFDALVPNPPQKAGIST
ncbi:MAG: hypothetical protein KF791_05950 [Verrucomicrobiae bacterium]|nr:hypothetical protein [Verrucomicrobiae bacterium]